MRPDEVNERDSSRNQTCDFLACSAVPKPTSLTLTTANWNSRLIDGKSVEGFVVDIESTTEYTLNIIVILND